MLAACLFCAGFAAAEKKYSGDIQLHGGLGTSSFDADRATEELDSFLFTFDIESWHLFKVSDAFSAGFMVSMDSALGTTEKVEIMGQEGDYGLTGEFSCNFGPAFAFTLGKVCRLGLTAGFDAGVQISHPYADYDSESEAEISFAGAGFDLGFQAKFVPESHVSPVVGWRYYKLYANEYDFKMTINDSVIEDATYKDDCNITNSIFYAGVSFNW